MSEEIVKVEEVNKIEPNPQENKLVKVNPDAFLERAIDAKLDINSLRELILLKKEWDADQAKKAYIEAMAKFQQECPVIVKSKQGGVTKTGQVAYRYAPIDVMLTTKDRDGKTVKALISDNGFSYTFNTPVTTNEEVEVTMLITHVAGHSELSTVKMPFVEKTGVMSPPQVIASTMSYAKRYAFMNGFGILTGDEDNDAQGRELLEEKFMELVKDWKSKDEIIAVANTIESLSVYRDFLLKLPKKDDIARFEKCLEKVERAKRLPLWNKFEKSAIAIKWVQLLEDLENKLNIGVEEAKIQSETIAGDNKKENPIDSEGKK